MEHSYCLGLVKNLRADILGLYTSISTIMFHYEDYSYINNHLY